MSNLQRKRTPKQVLSVECDHCGKEFEASRVTAKYCSTNCRVLAAYHRKKETA